MKSFNFLDRTYPEFNEGDEVIVMKQYTTLTKYNTYTILKCYKPHGFIDGYKGRVVELKNDWGHIGKYASDSFERTPRQMRVDKLKRIINI